MYNYTMPGYQRTQVATLLNRLAEPPRSIIILSGPRQTGKTTIVRQALDRTELEGTYLAVDEPASSSPPLSLSTESQVTTLSNDRDVKWLIRAWEKARLKDDSSNRGSVLVLDEIQKIPNWSETVKGLWDADRAAGRSLHVVMLGSAPLLMQHGLSESLAGRFELIRVNHWSFREMVDVFDFDLPSYIYFGGYPGAAHLIKYQSRWREYVRSSLMEPNIERDILSMTRVNKPALLKRVFELGSSYSGQILSYTKMQGQLQDAGNTTTLAHYLELLSHAGLLVGLQKYAGQQHRRRSSSPKLNVLNTSFMAVNSGYTFEEAQSDRTFWGRMVESAVGAHLYNTGAPDISLYYWRESPHEVDFVLEKGRKLVCIEVKSSSSDNYSGGLTAFQEHFASECALLVGGHGIPIEEFLTYPADHWFDSS